MLVLFFISAGGVMLLTGCVNLASAPDRGKDVQVNITEPNSKGQPISVDSSHKTPIIEKEENVRIPTSGDTNKVDENYYYLPENENISMEQIIMDNVQNLSEKQKKNRDVLIMNIIKNLGTPYVWGGNTRGSGLDCSGFTKLVFTEGFGLSMYRTARDQFTQGDVVPTFEDLQLGDLVFFDTRPAVKPGHVGIFLGNGMFAHASTKQGVIVSSFDIKYYREKYMGGRRFKQLFLSDE
jgi:cell wall-associated NlpC family hydrolase